MAKTRELKRRIRSIDNTRQITRTMEMVATSKLRRATERVYAARPYSERLTAVIGRLTDPELRARIAARGGALLEERGYDWRGTARRVVEVVEGSERVEQTA